MGMVLFKVLVFGEPITTPSSKESTRYWRHMNQADSDLENGRLDTVDVKYFVTDMRVVSQWCKHGA